MLPSSLNSLTIAPRRAADSEFIRVLSELVFAEYTRAAGHHTLRLSDDTRAVTLVARLAGRAVGFAVISFEAPAVSLVAIAVEPASRGLGIARRLLGSVEEEAARRGAVGFSMPLLSSFFWRGQRGNENLAIASLRRCEPDQVRRVLLSNHTASGRGAAPRAMPAP